MVKSMIKIKMFLLVILKKVFLAIKIIFTQNGIVVENIQENTIIFLIPKSKKADCVKAKMNAKKMLHISKYYKKKLQPHEGQHLIIKPYNPFVEKKVYKP